jgi:hypothetical protein
MQPDAGLPPDPEKKSPPLDGSGAAAPSTAEAGLPPVAPPSGKFILQLFLVPGLIVAALVLVALGLQWLFGPHRDPEKYLKDLDDPNPEVRWRAAADLSQELPRKEAFAQNVRFALALTERLDRALDANASAELAHKKRLRDEGDIAVPKPLQRERDFILFLTLCLGHFQTPVGATELGQLALGKTEGDAETVFRRRANAVKALMDLGANLQKFDSLDQAKRDELTARLKEESEAGGKRGRWAADTLAYLKDRAAGKSTDRLGVAAALVECAGAKAPFLRKEAGAALSVWDGPGVEAALLRLTRDDGRGTDPIERDPQEGEDPARRKEVVRRINEKQIRYTAALSLARRGSSLVADRLDLFQEMLDREQLVNFWEKAELGQEETPERAARDTIYVALRALNQLRRANRRVDLSELRRAIDNLADDSYEPISTQAKELKKQLQ